MSAPILNIVDGRVIATLSIQDNAAAVATAAAAEAEADALQTGLDRIATSADRVQTGLDRIATGNDVTAAGNSATLSQAWAESPTDIEPGKKSAKTWAGEAEIAATNAQADAIIAAASVSTMIPNIQKLALNGTLKLLDAYPTARVALSDRSLVTGINNPLYRVTRATGTVVADVYPDNEGKLSLDSPIKIISGTSLAYNLGELSASTGYTDVDGLGSQQDIVISKWYDWTDFGLDGNAASGSNITLVRSNANFNGEILFPTGSNNYINTFDSALVDRSKVFIFSTIRTISGAGFMLALTSGGVSSATFQLTIEVQATTLNLIVRYNNSTNSYAFTAIQNLNTVKSRCVYAYGIVLGRLYLYVNGVKLIDEEVIAGGPLLIEETIGGRSAGGVEKSVYSYVRFEEVLSENQIINISKILGRSNLVKNIELVSGFPVTIVPNLAPDSTNLANTGLSYDSDNDRIIVSQWNNSGDYNELVVFDRASLTELFRINVSANASSIQGNWYYNGIYYLENGGSSIIGFDEDGDVVFTGNLPFSLTASNSCTIFEDFLYCSVSGILYKMNPTTFDIIEQFIGFGTAEGLAVCEYGVWAHTGLTLFLRDWDRNIIHEISAIEPEGICVDKFGFVYNNRDEWFHGNIDGGNRLWKYKISDI